MAGPRCGLPYPVIVLNARARSRTSGIVGNPRLYVAAAAVAALGLTGCSASPASRPSHPASAGHSTPASGTPRLTAGGSTPAGTARPAPPPKLATSCHSVVHIGDSTSDGLTLAAFQPDAKLRIRAQYRRVGVTHFIPEVSGARSIVETWHGFPNGYTVAQQVLSRGYQGCWVIALGTNDTADVAVGSEVGLAARITRMMSLISPQPVMWVNVKTLLSSGPWAEANMLKWNRALMRACSRYPNMRVYNWAAAVRRSWFISDGIHYTPHGYAMRSRLIANALATAFPANLPLQQSPRLTGATAAPQPSCLVN
jgi:hypothetical protein